MIDLKSEILNQPSEDYPMAFNPAEALIRLYNNIDDEEAWKGLWEELHHQGDLWQSSYAAVPHILEIERRASHFNWNGFALIAIIEHCRPKNVQPKVGEIAEAYKKAWHDLPTVIGNHTAHEWDEYLTSSIFSCLAFARGQRAIACAAFELNESVAKDFLKWQLGLEGENLDQYIKAD